MQKYICDYCGKEFFKYPSQMKGYSRHFCGNECRYLANKLKDTVLYEKDYAYILLKKDDITKKVIFDVEDVNKVLKYKWHLHLNKKHRKELRYDACTNKFGKHIAGRYISMSRYLINCPKEYTVDHINRNPLDNRKCNLRIVSQFENNLNKGNNTTGCVGVYLNKGKTKKWRVYLKQKFIGSFNSFEEAVKVRKQAEKAYQLQNTV